MSHRAGYLGAPWRAGHGHGRPRQRHGAFLSTWYAPGQQSPIRRILTQRIFKRFKEHRNANDFARKFIREA